MRRKSTVLPLESLRGFASLFVVWHHVQVFRYLLDPGYALTGALGYAPPGHFCVLLFFVLSGYVIGLSTKQPLSWATVGLYLKKRLVRLYPIFLLTLLLTLLVAPTRFSLPAIGANLVLLQSVAGPDINPPAWSLHYEMLYYSLFVGISACRLNPLACAVGALLLGVGKYLLFPHAAPIVSAYAFGLVFWVLGLALSRALRGAAPVPLQPRELLSVLLLLLAVDQYNVFVPIFRKLALPLSPPLVSQPWSQVAISWLDLASLPVAVAIVALFAGQHFAGRRWVLAGLLALGGLRLGYVVAHAWAGTLDWAVFALPTGFFLASLLGRGVRGKWAEYLAKLLVLRAGAWLGTLSYGIYLVHVPLLFLFSRVTVFSGTPLTFAARFGLLLLATIGGGYLLECVLQPRIKHIFFKPAAA